MFCKIGETPELPPSSSEGKLGTPEKNWACGFDEVNLQDTFYDYDNDDINLLDNENDTKVANDDDEDNLHDNEDRDGAASDYRREEAGAPPGYDSANLG